MWRATAFVGLFGILAAGNALAQGSGMGRSPFGSSPQPPSAYALPPDSSGSLPSGIGHFYGVPASPYPAPQWGRYGENGWTLKPVRPGPAYGMDHQGNLYYTDPQTGLTQYYGTGETRYRGRFVP